MTFHQGICYKSVAKAGGRERKWQCCLATSTYGKQGKVLLPRVYKACAAAAVAVGITTTTALQEARCLHSYWHGKSPRVHSSTEAVVLAKAAKASSHLGWLLLFHSCSTIAAQSAVLTARSQEFCAAEAPEVPLLRLLVSKAQAKIFSLIFCQCFPFWQSNLGNVVFRCHHRRGYGRRGNGVENQQTNDLHRVQKIFLLMGYIIFESWRIHCSRV